MKRTSKFKVGEEVLFVPDWAKGRVERVLSSGEAPMYVISLGIVVSENELKELYEMPEVE